MTTSATARPRCSPRSTCSKAPCSAETCSAIGIRSSSASSTRWSARSRPGKVVHAILDNYAAHKTPEVRRWLARHPRWTFHFTPTSSSWLNAVEGFFAKLSRRRLKHGVFRSVMDLQAAINRFVAEHNHTPKPFVWRADPDEIIAARARGFQALEFVRSWGAGAPAFSSGIEGRVWPSSWSAPS